MARKINSVGDVCKISFVCETEIIFKNCQNNSLYVFPSSMTFKKAKNIIIKKQFALSWNDFTSFIF